MKFQWRRDLAVYRRLDSFLLYRCRTFYNTRRINSESVTPPLPPLTSAAAPAAPAAAAAALHSNNNYQNGIYRQQTSYFSSLSKFEKYSGASLRPRSFTLNSPTRSSPLFSPRFFRWTTAQRYPAIAAKMADQKWTGVKVRNTFFEYFQERGHTIGMHISRRNVWSSQITCVFGDFKASFI